MYADETVIFVKGKDHSEAAAQLTKVMENVSNWQNNCHLHMYFLLKQINHTQNLMFLYLDRES